MTIIEEKRKQLNAHCDSRKRCGDCPLKDWSTAACYFNGWTDTQISMAYEVVFNQPTPTTNAVEHPTHYNREGAMECIDEMLLIFGREAVMGFCLCNSWKYRYRAADKNGLEDLKKSDWYLAKYHELKAGEC